MINEQKKSKFILCFIFTLIFLIIGQENKSCADFVDSSATATEETEEEETSGGGTFLPPPASPEVNQEYSEEHPEIYKSLIINNENNYTNSLDVDLTLSAKNAFQMAISNTTDFNGVSWESYSISKNWNLTEGDGEKIVYAKFRSENGGVSEVVSDLIIFDSVPPINVSYLEAKIEDKKIKLFWLNPKEFDFAGIKINRSQQDYPLNPEIGIMKYDGSGDFFVDADILKGTTYFYTVFSYDKAGNYSSGAIISVILPIESIPENTSPEILSPEIPVIIPPEIIPIIRPDPPSPIFEKIDINDFSLKIKTNLGIVPLEISSQESQQLDGIKIIKDSPLSISIPADKFKKEVKIITVTISNDICSFSYFLKLNEKTGIFEAIITTPLKKGKYDLTFNIVYKDGTSEVISVEILIDPYGYIYEKIKNQELRIASAEISLFYLNQKNQKYELWPAEKYKQKNPQITDETGEYFFMVPRGKYYLEVIKDNYYFQTTDKFEVKDEIVNMNIEIKEIVSYDYKKRMMEILGLIILSLIAILSGIFIYKRFF